MVSALMYHDINRLPSIAKRSWNEIDIDTFKKQIFTIQKNNFRGISISQINKMIIDEYAKNDERYVCITFDDGYKSFINYAVPILQAYEYNATVFVIVSRIGKDGYLSWKDIIELNHMGFDVQSHALSHYPLELLPTSKIKEELYESKNRLQDKIKKEIQFISFPQGSYNDEVLEIAEECGYVGCMTSDVEFINEMKRPFKMGRIPVLRSIDEQRFVSILNCDIKAIRKMYITNRIKWSIKKLLGLENYLKLYTKYYNVQHSIFSNDD
jgi:peptidoglycan/xylan/chitin deacetylase (PgdA/CDA1 family)